MSLTQGTFEVTSHAPVLIQRATKIMIEISELGYTRLKWDSDFIVLASSLETLYKLLESSGGLQNSINYMLTSSLSGQKQGQQPPKTGLSESLMN